MLSQHYRLQGNILVLDLQSEQHPQYNRTKSFYGQPFIWCMLHNFGGTQGMHGSIRLVNAEIPRAAIMENSTMMGVGITPEGIHQNYVVYEFALEKAWQHQQINHKRWIKYFSNVRYGFASKEIEHAWLMLLKSVYAFERSENIRGKYTFCRRPTLKWQPWKWYDEKFVRKALGKFVTIAGDNETVAINDLFKRDLVDLTRQFLQNQADALYVSIVNAFRKKKNLKQFVFLSEHFLDLLTDLDALLGTHNDFLLGNFIESAKALASNDAERKQFEFNARNQITLWGPSGQIVDYATKQWNGIFEDYYRPRWSLFFGQLRNSLTKFILPSPQVNCLHSKI
jgi:alpha-N-acetylglucosaminidase